MNSTSESPSASRLEGFSDAVIAIILTIMVLELKLPDYAADAGFWNGVVKPLAPKLVSYALSFFFLALTWVSHHALMHFARHTHAPLVWVNILLLFFMSLVPFTTGFLGDHPFMPMAVAIYGSSLTAVGLSFTLFRWRVGLESRLKSADIKLHRSGLKRAFLSVLLYASSVPLAFISVYISMAIFLLVPVMFFEWQMRRLEAF